MSLRFVHFSNQIVYFKPFEKCFFFIRRRVEVANARESRVYLSNTTDYTGLISSRDRENGRKRQKQTGSGSPLNSESEKVVQRLLLKSKRILL